LPEETFRGARVGEHAEHAVIAFVTRRFVHLVGFLGLLLPRDHECPRPRPGGGVFHHDGVLEPIFVHSLEAFDQVKVFARSLELARRVEVGDVDDERIPLPVAGCIAVPVADARRSVRPAADRYRSYETLTLPEVVIDADLSWRLHDLIDRVEIWKKAC